MFYKRAGQSQWLSRYNTARGGLDVSLVQPPFDFTNTMVRIFPLRARMERLQTFINQYLNVVPEEAGHFRAYLPYVYLSFLHYGKMSVTAANLGWLSQYEVVFSIPLLWFKRVGGQLVFHDFASVAPFIYVDNDHSMTTGREVYGWPKNPIIADSVLASWMKDPEANPTVASFKSTMFSHLYVGARPQPRVFFEIRQRMGASLGRWPFNPNSAWLPWSALPRSITSSLNLMRDYGEVLRGLGLTRAQRGAGADTYARMAERVVHQLRPYEPEFVFNTLNLKQFRDAEQPHLAAYQALTNAPMKWKRVWRGGFLGDVRLLQGDSTGGLTVNLHHSPTAPIVELLGLEVAGERTVGDTTVHTLTPTFPMWLEADMQYNRARTIAWRVKGGAWRDEQGATLPAHDEQTVANAYNNARGAADTAIAGPFEFPKATLRVMPLLAEPERLGAFLRDYLGCSLREVGVEIAPWGRYVYLVATNYQKMSSATNDIGWWADRELAFYVPALLRRQGELWKIVLVPAYVYANSITAAQTGAEVSGIPVQHASIDSTNNTWMEDLGLEAWKRRTLLRVSTTLLPSADMGQELSQRLLLEVIEGDLIPANQEGLWREIAQNWGVRLKQENELKQAQTGVMDPARSQLDSKTNSERLQARLDVFTKARAFALQVLIRQRPIRVLTLKQFRDADTPENSCYQGIVEIQREITSIHEIEEIESSLYVRILQYPTHPIVERLGLVSVQQEYDSGGVTTHVLEPIRPFWMKVSLREHLGRNLFVHMASGEWLHGVESPGPRPEPIGEQSAQAVQYLMEPRLLSMLVNHDLPRLLGSQDPTSFESEGDLENIVKKIEPQCVLESILSEEWERWHGCRWARVQEELMRLLDVERRGKAVLEAAEAEFNFFAKLLSACKGNVPAQFVDAEFRNLAKLLADLLRYCLHLRCSVLNAADEQYNDYVHLLEETHWRKCFEIEGLREKYSPIRMEPSRQTNSDGELLAVSIGVQRKFIMSFLARAQRKPYHVIRRASIANEKQRLELFERGAGWDDTWYEGLSCARKEGI